MRPDNCSRVEAALAAATPATQVGQQVTLVFDLHLALVGARASAGSWSRGGSTFSFRRKGQRARLSTNRDCVCFIVFSCEVCFAWTEHCSAALPPGKTQRGAFTNKTHHHCFHGFCYVKAVSSWRRVAPKTVLLVLLSLASALSAGLSQSPPHLGLCGRNPQFRGCSHRALRPPGSQESAQQQGC